MGLDCGLDCGLDWDSTGTRLGLDCGSMRRGADNRLPPFRFRCDVTALLCIHLRGQHVSASPEAPDHRGATPTTSNTLAAPPPSANDAPMHGKGSRLSESMVWRSATAHARVIQCMCGASHVCKRQQCSSNCGAGRACVTVAVVWLVHTQCRSHHMDLTSVRKAATQHLCQGTVDGQYYASLFSVHVCSRPRTPCLILSRTKPVARPFRT